MDRVDQLKGSQSRKIEKLKRRYRLITLYEKEVSRFE